MNIFGKCYIDHLRSVWFSPVCRTNTIIFQVRNGVETWSIPVLSPSAPVHALGKRGCDLLSRARPREPLQSQARGQETDLEITSTSWVC